jgi:hypothetical protein
MQMTIPQKKQFRWLALGTSSLALILATWNPIFGQSSQVYVLLYQARTNNEGIHSVEYDGTHTVLMFDSKTDAESYAVKLTQQNFPTPSVEIIDAKEVQEFCLTEDYVCKFIPAGSQIEPPLQNNQ